MKQRVEITVRGLVQGVGYRAFAKRAADVLQVTGFAENMPDGSVRIIAEGEREKTGRVHQGVQEGTPRLLRLKALTKNGTHTEENLFTLSISEAS